MIDYVATHVNAIGLVGVSWVGNPEDTAQSISKRKVSMVPVLCDYCLPPIYVMPSRENLNSGRYPFIRGIYYMLRENYSGLGTGFVNFLKYEQGQLIFRRAYLRPVMDFDTRNVNIDTSVGD